jgi:hypothetical protein
MNQSTITFIERCGCLPHELDEVEEYEIPWHLSYDSYDN